MCGQDLWPSFCLSSEMGNTFNSTLPFQSANYLLHTKLIKKGRQEHKVMMKGMSNSCESHIVGLHVNLFFNVCYVFIVAFLLNLVSSLTFLYLDVGKLGPNIFTPSCTDVLLAQRRGYDLVRHYNMHKLKLVIRLVKFCSKGYCIAQTSPSGSNI